MYEFLQPQTLEQAVAMLKEKEDLRILAGGTDLLVGLRDRGISCRYVMDCKRIPELQALRRTGRGLEVGAAVSLNDLLGSGLLTGEYRILGQSAGELANYLLRNRATLVGNLCNASPGGDMAPACLVLDARLETVSPRGERRIPLRAFFTGVKRHVLEPDELAVKAVFPPRSGTGVYRKKRRIRGHDLAQASVAGFYGEGGELSLAFGAVGPTPLFARMGVYTPEELAEMRASIVDAAAERVRPITDVRSTGEYRAAMIRHFTGLVVDEFAKRTAVVV